MNRYLTRKTFFPSLHSDKEMQRKSCILVLTYYSVFHVEHSAVARKGSLFLWIHSIRRPAGRKATLFATEIIQRPNTSTQYQKCTQTLLLPNTSQFSMFSYISLFAYFILALRTKPHLFFCFLFLPLF